jgi:hypothetical protein
MPTVYVFKTTIETEQQAAEIGVSLNAIEAIAKWNFDLQDCDRILRIEAVQLEATRVCDMLKQSGFDCEELPDN